MPFDFMDMTGEDAVSWIRMNISCLLSGISHVCGLAPFQFFSVFLLVVVLFPFFYFTCMCDTELHAYIRWLLACRYACMHVHAHGYRVCIESRGRFRKCSQLLFCIIHRGSFSVRQSSLTQVGSLANLLLGSFISAFQGWNYR